MRGLGKPGNEPTGGPSPYWENSWSVVMGNFLCRLVRDGWRTFRWTRLLWLYCVWRAILWDPSCRLPSWCWWLLSSSLEVRRRNCAPSQEMARQQRKKAQHQARTPSSGRFMVCVDVSTSLNQKTLSLLGWWLPEAGFHLYCQVETTRGASLSLLYQTHKFQKPSKFSRRWQLNLFGPIMENAAWLPFRASFDEPQPWDIQKNLALCGSCQKPALFEYDRATQTQSATDLLGRVNRNRPGRRAIMFKHLKCDNNLAVPAKFCTQLTDKSFRFFLIVNVTVKICNIKHQNLRMWEKTEY